MSNLKFVLSRVPLTAAVLICSSTTLSARDGLDYRDIIHAADSFYQVKAYAASAKTYNAAFRQNGDLAPVPHRYNSACSWALAGESDSAFHQLYRIAEKGDYANISWLTSDSDLDDLHGDPRWKPLTERVIANKTEREKGYDKPLVAQLDSIYDLDQTMRREVAPLAEAYGYDSDEMRALWEKISYQDSINELAVIDILDTRGWLGADIIGGKGNQTLFLVIQHADLEVQERYLPMMREAVADGRAQGSALALLEDRVALRRGGKQIYGSQIGRDSETDESYVDDLVEPELVDERRASVGLGPIAAYTKMMGFEWDLDRYLEREAARAAAASSTDGEEKPSAEP